MSGGRNSESRRRGSGEGKKSGVSRTSRSGLLPSGIVWSNDNTRQQQEQQKHNQSSMSASSLLWSTNTTHQEDQQRQHKSMLPSSVLWTSDTTQQQLKQQQQQHQSSLLSLLHNGGNILLDSYASDARAAVIVANGDRSSDSEDSGATSGATSCKEASPGCEESSGSEHSSAAPSHDELGDDTTVRSRPSLPRSRTTPMLNGGRHNALDDALKPLTLYGPETPGGLMRVRATHEVNMSKLAYLEALFTRAKLDEARLSDGTREPNARGHQSRSKAPRSLQSPDNGYKTLPSSISDHNLRGLSAGLSTPTLPDGHTLLRTIESRLQLARPRENGSASRSFYQCGNSNSAGSLTHLPGISPVTSGASTPRYLSPSRKDAPLSLPPVTTTGLTALSTQKRAEVTPTRTSAHTNQRSLPNHYRSRSAYSSPAVSPQRGPDPTSGFLNSNTAPRRFSSMELRVAPPVTSASAPRNLPIRHTSHGYPTAVFPLSPVSPAQGAQAFHRKMQLFFDIMDTQSRFYKDLQSEIESHKDVLASLNATGQKLLGTLDNQEEAVMLQRRLEEMNSRWNTLKHKSIAIRNRLEGNTENWTTLLLSLRELIEWVIRKDTELTALGPLVGDIGTLSKYGEDIGGFKRVIEEKQPVIESNLKSGRQLIASEPPLSDTSDSEAGRELDGDARYRGDETARDLTRAVRREVAKLSEKWAALRERVSAITTHTDLALKKLGVLLKTLEDVGLRLGESERVVDGWGTLPQDSNLADQHAHNVRKFRDGLIELQRGIDDVNDQAARFSTHNVPLTPANSAKLHDLNTRWKNLEASVNERWRQVGSGRSREVTPLTPAQLASSVGPPWERATTNNTVPYYINHDLESTHWDHPLMMDTLESLTQFNHIKFSAYRTATKLRVLQKRLGLDRAYMQTATDIFDEQGLRGQNDKLIDVSDIITILSSLYASISADNPELDATLAMDLCLNWLLNVYDSQRTGQIRVLSFKIGLVCLCMGHLEEKYKYMFRLIADPNRLVDQRKLGLLLHDCLQVPRQLGEVAAFGGSNIEPSVRSCFTKAGKDRDTIEAVHFLSWVQQEPQSLVWLAVLHRVAASETIQHQVKCNICRAFPINGLRYRCLKCFSFDMCQECFFDGRSTKGHKITHPMHEYCTATTAGEDVKDFTKALKNKFKSKRSLQKHTKKGYLPVQSVLEGDALESPSPSPQHNVSSQDMHSRLEMYASRLAEVELRTNSNSTPDSEDEHGLIAQYCQSLTSSDAPLPIPRSPLQIMAAVDADQKDELEQMIRALEEENTVLQAEYDRLKSQQPVGSPPEDPLGVQRSEAEMLAEAKLLRQHKGRLEARMGILEEHNRQLEAQLHRLRQLLGEPSGGGLSSPSKSNTLQTKSVTASQLAMDSPAKINGHANQGEVGRAVGSLVATMNQEVERDLHREESDSESEENNETTTTTTTTTTTKDKQDN